MTHINPISLAAQFSGANKTKKTKNGTKVKEEPTYLKQSTGEETSRAQRKPGSDVPKAATKKTKKP